MSACDCEPPTVSNRSTPIARVPHDCDECHLEIPKGDQYERERGLWHDRWDTWRTCLRCAAARRWFETIPSYGECVALGRLASALDEWAHYEQGLTRIEPADPAIAGWVLGLVMARWFESDEDTQALLAKTRERRRETQCRAT